MKLFAASLLMLCVTLPPHAPEGEVRCTCRPSPPGGVTQCQPGQTAVCRGKGGVCQGSCVSLSAQLEPMRYSAELLKATTGEEVTEAALKKNPKEAKKLLERVIELSDRGKSGDIKVMGRKHYVGIGLSEVAKGKLKAAIKALVVPVHVTIPPIFRP
jgi:hypothetical protein